ncbi:MAG: hypothetical protein V4674_02965 [Patescibacteria group bacterium]
MSQGKLTPKFLTVENARVIVPLVLNTTLRLSPVFKRKDCHIVILVPEMKDDRATDYRGWPDYPITPAVLHEHSEGDPEKWEYKYKDIARCKALQLWDGRNDGGTDIQPHLLFAGDTPFWGGVKRHGIVVAMSGVQPHFDRMVSGMIADMLVGYAYHDWMESSDKKDDELCFLT